MRLSKNEMLTVQSFYINLPIRLWPESLKATQKNVGKVIGSCGDVIVDTIEAWLLNGRKELTYDEVEATLEKSQS